MAYIFALLVHFTTTLSADYCALPFCLSYYNGCNSCGCTTHSGLAMCTLKYCDIETTTAAYCTQCDHNMHWLKFGSSCGFYQSCDSRFIDCSCIMQDVSTCACPLGYYLATALDNATACIQEAHCPSLGQKLDTITDDMVFELPTDDLPTCSYSYQICHHDGECDKGFYCDTYDEDVFYESDCIPLHCYLDSDCIPYDCLSDCVGIGYGRCVRLEEAITTTPSMETTEITNTDWSAILVKLATQLNIWHSHNIDQYVYSAQISCFCMPCARTKKFITVQQDEILNIAFEQNAYNCTENDLIDYDYNTIDGWFLRTTSYAQQMQDQCGVNAVTTGSSMGWDPCRDKSLDVEYDETYGYPTKIVFDVEAMAYDGGSLWTFDCLDVYDNGAFVGAQQSCDVLGTFPTTTSDVDTTETTQESESCECEDGSIVERDVNNDCELQCRIFNRNQSYANCHYFGAILVFMVWVLK